MKEKIYLFFAIAFWGWSFILTKILLEYVTPVELMGLRFITGLPVLFLVVLIKKIKFSFEPSDWKYIIFGALIITAHFLVQIYGLKYTSATNTGWIIGVTPLVIAVFSFLILRESIGFKGIVGIIVATSGIILLVSKGKIGSLEWLKSGGDWLILLTTHTWAFYTIFTRNIARKYNPLAVTFAILVPSAILLVGYMAFTSDWSRFIELPLEPMISLFILGIFCLAVAHWFWQEGVAKHGATKAGLFLYLEPLVTTAIAVPYLGEYFGFFTAVGGGLVLMGVYIASKKKT